MKRKLLLAALDRTGWWHRGRYHLSSRLRADFRISPLIFASGSPGSLAIFAAISRASSLLSSLGAEHAMRGQPGQLVPIIGWTEVAFESLQGVAK
jgi:hypothetical protein